MKNTPNQNNSQSIEPTPITQTGGSHFSSIDTIAAANQPDPMITFTVGRASSGEPQSKQHRLDSDGLITEPPRFATTGTLTPVQCRLSEFASHFDEPNAFGVLGVPVGVANSQPIPLTTAQKELAPNLGIARTSKNFCWPEGNALLMLDIDLKAEHCVPPMPVRLEHDVALAMVEQGLGISLAGIARLIRPSASAGIIREVDYSVLKDSNGYHLYMALTGTTPDKVLECLTKRLVIAGHGHASINSCGQVLIRTPFDAAVGQTNRVDFAAKPTLGAGLIRRPQSEKFEPGMVLNLTGVDLTVDEDAYKSAVDKLKSQPEVREMQIERAEVWTQDRATKYEDNLSPQQALAKAVNLSQRIIKGEAIDLYPEDGIEFIFDIGGKVDLPTLLERSSEFDGLSLADPLDAANEPCKAKFYANIKTGKPCIHSFAHGAQLYFLHARDERHLYFPRDKDRNCFGVYDEKCGYPGHLTKSPGLYEHQLVAQGQGENREFVVKDTFIAAPLHVTAGTSDERGNGHGLVLKFKDIQDRSHCWAMELCSKVVDEQLMEAAYS
jgi:hypothetical protein